LKQKKEKETCSKAKEISRLTWILYVLLAVIIVVYAATGSAIFGAIALLLIAMIIVFEVSTSLKSEGLRKSMTDVASAIGAALLVWALLIFILHTSAPVDAVSSCSMLPELQRGDLVLLHGIDNVTSFIRDTKVPIVEVSKSDFQNMQNSISNEFLAYFAYFKGNKSAISYIIPNNLAYEVGLYNTACLSAKGFSGKQSQFYQCLVPESAQNNNLIRYSYSVGKIADSNRTFDAIYTSRISIGGRNITANLSNPIIIYETTGRDAFSGSIIHRLYAILNVSGSYYFLTKGDNNQALDIEFANYPINQSSVLGYVVAQVPLIGYVKLLLSGQIAVPAGCNQVLSQ